jgi:hypothetical protein
VNEADHKRKLVAEVNAFRGGWARRVEDRWAVGVLDLIIKLPGVPIVFAEGKLIKGHKFGPTERQFIEGEKLQEADLKAILIGWKEATISISPWTMQADRRECFNGVGDLTTLLRYFTQASWR